MDKNDALDVLLIKQEITEQLYAYCRAMDRIDNSLALNVLCPDATVDYGQSFKGTGQEFVEWVSQQHLNLKGTSHQISNLLIEVNGNHANSEAYVTMAGRIEHEGRVLEQRVRGRYVDRWFNRDDQWVIEERQFIHDFGNVSELANQGMPPSEQSQQNRTDHSYRVLEKW